MLGDLGAENWGVAYTRYLPEGAVDTLNGEFQWVARDAKGLADGLNYLRAGFSIGLLIGRLAGPPQPFAAVGEVQAHARPRAFGIFPGNRVEN